MDIRPARPDDRGDIAALIYSAGPELYDFLYRTERHPATDFIAHEFASGRGFCGWRNVTVAVQDGEVVATGCFYDGRQAGALTLGTVRNAMDFFPLREVLPMLWRARQVTGVMTTPRRDELYLANFGVAPSVRGQGVGRAMVDYQLATAKARGYHVFSLDVAVNNPRAQTLYERLGLVVTRERRFTGRRPGVTPPHARKMERVL